jgi:hypothetical protein
VYGDTPNLVPALLGQLDGLGERVERVHRVCVSVPADGHAAVSAGSGISYAAMSPRQHKPCHDLIGPTTIIAWLVRATSAVRGYQQVRRLYGGNQETRSTQFT